MYKNIIKRFLDVIFSILILPFLLIIILIVGIFIILEDQGPIFYTAPRLGKNGENFKMFKFRSMKVDASDIRNEDGSTFNSDDDPRVTKTGKILRKTSIDEIPQLLNVLKGDMSIIGPRPDLPEHYKLYEDNEDRKLEVSPGITGYSQAYFRNSIPWKERIQNDIYYVDHISLWFDVKIIFKTIQSVFLSDNIYIEDNGNKGE